jgi:hypothetical protein
VKKRKAAKEREGKKIRKGGFGKGQKKGQER